MAVPTAPTWTAGDNATSSKMQSLSDAANFGLGSPTSTAARKPLAYLRQTTVGGQSIPNNTFTAATFDVEDVDYDSGHSTVTNTDRYTAATAGWYLLAGGGAFAGNASGRRGARFTVNGTAVNGSEVVFPASAANGVTATARTTVAYLNVGDIVRLELFQDSGGALSTTVGTSSQPSMTVLWVSN